jgi:LysR family glycine cleavage system transcriptional activator
MAHDALIQEHLADGRLVAPFDVRMAAKARYYAVTPERTGQEPAVRAFIEWLFAEARSASRR